jgi:hypothetical protein
MSGRPGQTRMRQLIALAAVAALGAAAPAWAQSKCELYAHVVDRDPAGVNVRAEPANHGKVVGVLKFQNADDDIAVDITAENSGWFRIKSFEHFNETKSGKIDGWVRGSRLGTGLKIMDSGKASERLLEEPSPRSKTLLLFTWDPGQDGKGAGLWADLPGNKREKIDYEKKKGAATPTLLGCANGYVKIRMNNKYEGWVPAARLCGSPVTTCP